VTHSFLRNTTLRNIQHHLSVTNILLLRIPIFVLLVMAYSKLSGGREPNKYFDKFLNLNFVRVCRILISFAFSSVETRNGFCIFYFVKNAQQFITYVACSCPVGALILVFSVFFFFFFAVVYP